MTTTLIFILLGLIELQLLIYFLYKGGVRLRLHGGDNPVFVDTSSLMDGRVVAIARCGFLPHTIVIPRSVIMELQLLADGGDNDKRARARRGLDVVKELQELPDYRVRMLSDTARDGVDNHLLSLAARHHGTILTMDFNLMKVATTDGIKTLNINELAQVLRMNYLPGETLSLLIAQKGNDAHQGVGYLADGTMVVVEQAKRDIGQTVEIEIIRSIQTTAGKMLFAKKRDKSNRKPNTSKSSKSGEDSLLKTIARQSD